MASGVFVQASESVRHYVVRLERGDDVHEALTGFAQTHGVLGAWVRAVGWLEHCTLVDYDQHRKAYGSPRRIYGPTQALSIEGNLSLREGNAFPRLAACLSREGDNGIEVLGGQLESARAFSLDLHITVFEDIALVRTNDSNTGLPVWMHTDSRPVTTARTVAPAPIAAPAPEVVHAPAPPPPAPQVMIARGIGSPPTPPPTPAPVVAPKPSLSDVARQLEAMPVRQKVEQTIDAGEDMAPGDILLHPRWEDVEVVRETANGGYDVRLKTGMVREISLEVFELVPGQPRNGKKVWVLRPRARR